MTTIATLWAELLVEELVRNGVTHFCIAPGSRSTPLVLAAASNKKAKKIVHFDERGLGFFALGLSKGGRKAAIITTSGTAVANLLPAVVEASQDHVPLILLTADRPPELVDTGANQAILQDGIFGRYVRWQTNLSTPTTEILPSYLLTTIDFAVRHTGPVHINCPIREGLPEADFSDYVKPVAIWKKSGRPYTQWVNDIHLKEATIVAGRLNEREAQAVLTLAQRRKWPVVADICSQLAHKDKPKGDTILWFGGYVTSKETQALLKNRTVVHVSPHLQRMDPDHNVSIRVQSDIVAFCEGLP